MTKHRNEVYKDRAGIFWARFNGKRITPNTRKAADELFTDMRDEAERAAILAGDESAPRVQGLEVIVLRGVPGCGKTTWAREFMAEHYWYRRISRDGLRAMLDFGEYSHEREKLIRELRKRLIRDLLRDGEYLIIDDTNLTERDMRDIRSAATMYSHVIGVERFVAIPIRIIEFDTPLDECIRRDSLRDKPVGADRITVMWYDYHHIDSEEEYQAYRAAKKRIGKESNNWWER